MDARLRGEARAAYVRSFEGPAWKRASDDVLGRISRGAVPVVLAAIVGIYMTWAITAASALVH